MKAFAIRMDTEFQKKRKFMPQHMNNILYMPQTLDFTGFLIFELDVI